MTNEFTGTIEDAWVHTYNGEKCLELKVHYTDILGNVHEVKIPHIVLSQECFKIQWEQSHDLSPRTKKNGKVSSKNRCLISNNVYLNIGDNLYSLKKGSGTEGYATRTLIEKAQPKEMTMEELEKELGYSVKIVSEKEKS